MNHYRNLLILIVVFGFSTFTGWSEKTDAQTKKAVEKTPASVKPTPSAKKQIIVSVTAARIRSDKNLQSDTLQYADLGTVFTVLEETDEWSKIKLPDNKEGWISKTITEDFSSANKTKIYNSIADKYLVNEKLDFLTAANVYYFLKKAGNETESAELELKAYKMLAKTLALMPFDKLNENPYKNFTDKNESEIVYSEPAGQWFVHAERLWELHAKNKNKPLGEEIAWQAAQTFLPGECEGYVNCYVYTLRVTDGEYLNFYPAGKHSRQALLNITNFLEPIYQDAGQKAVYTGPYDISDRAELNKHLAELRMIISKTPYVEKQKTINQINKIAEAFK